MTAGSKIDFLDRRFDGKVGDHEFSCYVDGTIACSRVADHIRDEMRLVAADAFLSSGRALDLTSSERAFWSKVRTVDPEHRAFFNGEKE